MRCRLISGPETGGFLGSWKERDALGLIVFTGLVFNDYPDRSALGVEIRGVKSRDGWVAFSSSDKHPDYGSLVMKG